MRYHVSPLIVAITFLMQSWIVAQDKQAPSVETLLKQLENSAAEQRVEAASALGKLGLPATAAVDDLAKLLDDPNPNVRGAAAQALGAIGAPAKATAPLLYKLFRDVDVTENSEPIWHIAATAYGKLGSDSLPLLIEELKSNEQLAVYTAATAIHQMGSSGKPAVPTLVEALRKNDPATRIAFIYAFMGIGPDAEPAVPALIETMHSDDFHTRYWSCRAIGKIGLPGAKDAVPELIKLLSDMVASVRGNAAAALGNLGPNVGPEAIPALTNATKDKLYSVRTSAVVALGQMGPAAIASLPQIDACLANKSFAARSQAAVARWQITRQVEPTVEVLVAELENRDAPWDAARGFEQMGKAAAVAVDRLVKLLDSNDRETRVWTASSLASIGASSKPALPKLTEMLKDEEEEIREVAAEAIQIIEKAAK
jgi:HEAT repeat protein